MISLALVMVRARFAQAFTVFLLAMVAIGAAVAGPTYVEASQRSIVAVAVASATTDEITVVASDGVQVRAQPDDERELARVAASKARAFDKNAAKTAHLAGFDTVFGVNFAVAVATSESALELAAPVQHLLFRDGACQRVEIVAGRCDAGPGEVLLHEEAAKRHGLGPGSTVLVQPKTYIETPLETILVSTGQPTSLSIVGTYRPRDPGDLFWGLGGLRGGAQFEPLLVSRATLTAVDHLQETQTVTIFPLPGSLTVERLETLDVDLTAMQTSMLEAGLSPLTSMPKLLDRVQADREQSAILPAVAAVPLILLCCLVVFLAAASTTQARRVELGMLSLRGTWAVDRWWLGSAEVVVPVLAGGAVGYLFGQASVWAFTRLTLPGPWPSTFSTEALPQALLASGAALAAGLLALRRDLASPVAELLRRVPSHASKWLARLLQAVAVVIAVAAVVELRSSEDLTGVSQLAPALVIVAIALIGSAGFDPLMRRLGRRALRRGSPGLALGALHLGRRGGGSRLVALLAVAVGLVAFAAISSEVGIRGRTAQVSANLGAARVITVQATTARALLHAVRQVDPDGSFAMAVMSMTTRDGATRILAVDSPALAEVAHWPEGNNMAPPQVAKTISPALAEPTVVRGTGLVLELEVSAPGLAAFIEDLQRQDPQSNFEHYRRTIGRVTAVLAPLNGSPVQSVPFVGLREGHITVTSPASCQDGCRLSALQVSPFVPIPVTVAVKQIRQTGPDAVVADASNLATWVGRGTGEAPTSGDTGLTIAADGSDDTFVAGPPDRPASLLPAVASADAAGFAIPTRPAGTVSGGGGSVGASREGSAAALPRVGMAGALVDLELLTRMSEPGPTQPAEVWLAPSAPADAFDRLRDAGLVPVQDRTLADELRLGGQRPNAVGLRFLLAMGLLCLGLGLGGLTVAAGAERRTRGDELRALRGQGLSRRAAARAGRVSYVTLVLAAALLGAMAAMAAWVAVGERLPLVDVIMAGIAVPRWPGLPAALAWVGATVVLAAAAHLLTMALSRSANTRLNARSNGRNRGSSR